MSKEQDRKEILQLVGEYYKKYHTKKSYEPGDRIPYAGRVYDQDEMINLADAMLEFWLTAGRFCKEFESKMESFLGVKHCCLVNSGSSANLIAFMALTSPMLGDRRINRGDEVITVAAGFPTTINPIMQFGAVPVFVDVTLPTYNVDVDLVEKAISNKTKAVFLAHTLGNPFDIKRIKDICGKNGLWLIEDNCDALGSTYDVDGVKGFTGTFGDIGTSSFYPPHHITMGEGGAVYTNNSMLYKIILSMRDWGRDCICASGQDNLCGHRFDGQFGELPSGYDHKYVYSHFGYNLKATDLQAAVGCAQLNKIEEFVEKRKTNFRYLYTGLDECTDKLILPEATSHSEPSWFGFLITCKDSIDRNEVTKYLEEHGIQTRLLFAGNMLKQPCFDEYREAGKGYRVVGNLENTDRIMNNSFWIGVYPGMTKPMLDEMIKRIKEAIQ